MDPMIDRIGGERQVHLLVNHFYDLIETLPQGAAIMAMHQRGHGLSHVRPAQFEFLCGFFGGRRYYAERHGHMNLREIHAHVEIRRQDAEDWLAVMDRAMVETGVADRERAEITATFRRAALMLVNTD
ncbi:group II truncated hemoglobin [Tabrizicola flagellatus]|uniref:group II truncated hemoglobin n=1 Tax=Tabrizicola flagellatus TaxID=2593021 RepID=UPI0011F27160|nr:group II truncated hemoglobin [Tabrizicola flagellatus]